MVPTNGMKEQHEHVKVNLESKNSTESRPFDVQEGVFVNGKYEYIKIYHSVCAAQSFDLKCHAIPIASRRKGGVKNCLWGLGASGETQNVNFQSLTELPGSNLQLE
ncbi:hypothetical protein RUM44_007478 [Polyplax serrata]|uniref:Uncharacterized protein n=1 Tax=Polyplax serrata TaxID=468196 RepID=A0ABR1B0U8_POLSC